MTKCIFVLLSQQVQARRSMTTLCTVALSFFAWLSLAQRLL
jgi:hypothetical protein